MSFHPISPTPSASSEIVTLCITPSEFALLATFMAPLGINESKGESVWVTGCTNGPREWIATAHDVTAVISPNGRTDSSHRRGHSFEWAYPISEHILILLGKIMAVSDDVMLALSDDRVAISTARFNATMAQISRPRIPPLRPPNSSQTGLTVNAAELLMMLTSVATWPAGGFTPEHEPIVTCRYDFQQQCLTLLPNWGDVTIGRPRYQIPATISIETDTNPAKFAPFNIHHRTLMNFLRDPLTSSRIGDITLHQPAPGTHQHCLSGSHWIVHLPIIGDIDPWGHDLEEVLAEIPLYWVDPQRVQLAPPQLAPARLDLEALVIRDAFALYRYRLTFEILSNVIPTVHLYEEINDFNQTASGCQLVIEKSSLIAQRQLTDRDYESLRDHVLAFIASMTGLAPLFSALAY
jgi:hypothetical protein